MVGKSILQGIALPAPHLFGEKRNLFFRGKNIEKTSLFFQYSEN